MIVKTLHYTISIDNKQYLFYLDTGNTCVVDGYPVLFLKDTFDHNVCKKIWIQGVNQASEVDAIKTECIINGKKEEVYIAFCKLDIEEDGLMNMLIVYKEGLSV